MLEINKYNKIIAANWKLNGSSEFIESYFQYLEASVTEKNLCNIICPPNLYLEKCIKKIKNFHFGAQDCSNYTNGAFTGDISASMLKDIKCQFCIIGHSERRNIFKETDKDVNLKLINLIKEDINPIICIGENFQEKKQGKTKEILKKQLTECLPINSSNNNIIIAYEPIWAIGTGITPTLQEIDEIHSFLKKDINGYENYKIIYGGSVKSTNASEIMALRNVDGVLVGGASLDPIEFSKIIKA